MVKTKRKSNRKSVSRKTAKNKSNNLQIFKQKLKKIQRDLVKLNKKYADRTFKGGAPKNSVQDVTDKLNEEVENMSKLAIRTVDRMSPDSEKLREVIAQARETAETIRETGHNARSNPKMFSGFLEAIKSFFQTLFELFMSFRKGSSKDSAEQSPSAASGEPPSENMSVVDQIREKHGLSARTRTTVDKTAAVDDDAARFADLSKQLRQLF